MAKRVLMEWILLLMESFQKAEEEEENGMKMEVAEVLGAAAEEKMVVARLLDRVKMGEKGQGGLTIMAAAAAADLYLWELMAPKAPAEKAVLAFLILLLLAHILLAGGAEEHFMAVLSARAAWAAAGDRARSGIPARIPRSPASPCPTPALRRLGRS